MSLTLTVIPEKPDLVIEVGSASITVAQQQQMVVEISPEGKQGIKGESSDALDSTKFSKNLSLSDTTIQKSLETLDQAGNDYVNDFQTGLL
jgi:hypothetical protein